jgi:DNA-binding NtrC family response regulator
MAQILVLSDQGGIREALQSILTELGHSVSASLLTQNTSPVDRSLSPQVVLVDLPGFAQKEDGTISVLRRRYPTARFIALFGGGSGNLVRLARLWGVDVCFFKPFALDALIAAIQGQPLPVDQAPEFPIRL